jgi:hypothetical protein
MPKKVTTKKPKKVPKPKAKSPPKKEPPGFNETMQDNVLLNTLLLIVRQALEFESYPEILYWPMSQSVEMLFMEDRLDDVQMERFSILCGYPKDYPLNGNPMYRISVYDEIFDHKTQEMKKADGLAISINIDFTEEDWQRMVAAKRGDIIKFEKKE